MKSKKSTKFTSKFGKNNDFNNKNNNDNYNDNINKNKFSVLLTDNGDNNSDNCDSVYNARGDNKIKTNQNKTENKQMRFNNRRINNNSSYTDYNINKSNNTNEKKETKEKINNIVDINDTAHKDTTTFTSKFSINNKFNNHDNRDYRDNETKETLKEYYNDNEQTTNIEMGDNLYLNSKWTIWIHDFITDDWSVESYKNIYTIDSIGSFWRFFNNFYSLDRTKNKFYIMRNQIKPVWEANDNINGGIFSIKLNNCLSRRNNIDLSIKFMISITMLIVNETFIRDYNRINGIEYAIKSGSVLIKIWYKKYDESFLQNIPINLIQKITSHLKNEQNIKNEHFINKKKSRYDNKHYEQNKMREQREQIQFKNSPIKPEEKYLKQFK